MDITPRQVLKLVLKIRRQLGYKTLVKPRIKAVYYDEETNSALVVVADRPDKSVVVGPGGRIIKAVKDELGLSGIGARSYTDILVKRRRVREALSKTEKIARKASGLLGEALERVVELLKAELAYPPRRWPSFDPLDQHAIAVGFSGGVDSTAMLYVAQRIGLEPLAISVDAGGWMLPPEIKELMASITSNLGIKHVYLPGDREVFDQVLQLAREGRRHPCRMCHAEIERAVIEHALGAGVPIVGFGDLLPTGRFSIYWLRRGGLRLLRLNLLASLALLKTDTILMARAVGHPVKRLYFGCQLLKLVHREHREMRLASIQRVLRETRASILEPNQALELVKSIIR